MSTTVIQCPNCGRRNRVPAAASGIPRCSRCHTKLPWLADAGDDDFADVVDHAELPVVVDMWAPWCAPCRQVSPALEQVAKDLAGQMKLVKVDVDKAPKLADRFTVRAVPTLLIMNGGQILDRRTGAASASVIRQWVDATLATSPRAPMS